MPFPSFPDSATLLGTSYPQRHSPGFETARWTALSGKRTIAPKSTFPRWSWAVPFSFLRSRAYANNSGAYQELETLVGFFNARSSDGQCFVYRDPEDNSATAQGFGAGDGDTTEFQLYRTFGGFTEPVYAPLDVTSISAGGVVVDPSDYTVGDTGRVTFTVAPADGDALTWTGEFGWLCRFDTDVLALERFLQGLSRTGDALTFSAELGL